MKNQTWILSGLGLIAIWVLAMSQTWYGALTGFSILFGASYGLPGLVTGALLLTLGLWGLAIFFLAKGLKESE